ncbi:MAG: hypothetical protein RSB71_04185, partial [Bacilli bacterium]
GVKIYNDNKLFEPKDANGSLVETYVINGTTYLPARAIATLFKTNIQYESTTNSVYIGKHYEKVNKDYLYLSDDLSKSLTEAHQQFTYLKAMVPVVTKQDLAVKELYYHCLNLEKNINSQTDPKLIKEFQECKETINKLYLDLMSQFKDVEVYNIEEYFKKWEINTSATDSDLGLIKYYIKLIQDVYDANALVLEQSKPENITKYYNELNKLVSIDKVKSL